MMVQEFYRDFQVARAAGSHWQNEVIGLIGPRQTQTLAPLRAILDIARRLRVRTVVIERNYLDQDFFDEYLAFFSRAFHRQTPECIRLHFFREGFAAGDFPYVSLDEMGYLGFSVVRPTESYSTGSTVIRAPSEARDPMYSLCEATFNVDLVGNRLRVTGMPYMQSHPAVNGCAHVVLWIASLYMHRRFGTPRRVLSEIARAAIGVSTPNLVRAGLTLDETLNAIHNMGWATHKFAHSDVDFTARVICAYVDSGLPVILVVRDDTGAHAVVAIGHDFHLRTGSPPDPVWATFWIDNLYIHDTGSGPYAQMQIRKPVLGGANGRLSVVENLQYAIVPVHPSVRLSADDIFDHVVILMQNLNDLLAPLVGGGDLDFSPAELGGLALRTYLQPSNDFKVNLPSEMSPVIRHCYRAMRMPQFIWITEVSYHSLMNSKRIHEQRIVGEIIVDSTAETMDGLHSYQAIHVAGRMLVRDPVEGGFHLYADLSEKPYSSHLHARVG